MSSGKVDTYRVLRCGVKSGALTVLLTLLLLIPAALFVSREALGKEQCSTVCALCLFAAAILTQAMQKTEKGKGRRAAALVSTLVIMTILLLFSAGIPACRPQIRNFAFMLISALIGSLTGTTFRINCLYNKKQNRYKQYNK